MRKIVSMIAAVLLVGAGSLPVHELPPLIRLHVLAESDSAQDQALKMEVRDAVLSTAQGMLADCTDFRQAYAILDARIGEIEQAAQSAAGEKAVCAQIGVEQYPDRDYGQFMLPAGAYHSLKVEIGAGRGQNWWCIVYPSLCMPGAADANEITELMRKQPLRSAVWDWIKERWQGFMAERQVL